MARAVKNQPRRVCRPVDAALGQQLLAFSLEEAKLKAARAGVTNQNFHFSLRHTVPRSSRAGLTPNMAIVVPKTDCWLRQVVFVAQRTQARRTKQKVSPGRRFQSEPASGKHAQDMSAGKKQYVPLHRARAFDRAVCPRPDLVRRFPSGASITKQLPLEALLVDISGEAALILAVVPFEQVPVDFGHSSKARQLAGSGSTLQRAGKHLGESHSAQPFLKPARIALATFCQR